MKAVEILSCTSHYYFVCCNYNISLLAYNAKFRHKHAISLSCHKCGHNINVSHICDYSDNCVLDSFNPSHSGVRSYIYIITMFVRICLLNLPKKRGGERMAYGCI